MSEKIIRVKCPNLACQRILSVPEAARGRMVRCKACGGSLTIPAPSAAPAPTEAKSAGS